MKGTYWALLLKPFILFFFMISLATIRWLVMRCFPNGKLKRILLYKLWD